MRARRDRSISRFATASSRARVMASVLEEARSALRAFLRSASWPTCAAWACSWRWSGSPKRAPALHLFVADHVLGLDPKFCGWWGQDFPEQRCLVLHGRVGQPEP